MGKKTDYVYEGADAKLLEKFENPFDADALRVKGAFGSIKIKVPEFTSLCPLTGQPDFAKIIIEYVPRRCCVESKSLKLYMGSFRNVGEFHESCVARIGRDLVALLEPEQLSVHGKFTPRGGIPFWPRFDYFAPIRVVDDGNARVEVEVGVDQFARQKKPHPRG